MCNADGTCCRGTLTFETLLSDPLTRMMMESDGVSVAQLTEILTVARIALTQREQAAFQTVSTLNATR